MSDYQLDAKGLKCPMPVLKAKKIIKQMKPGETFELIADDRGAKADVPPLLNKTACTLEKLEESNGVFTFLIKKN